MIEFSLMITINFTSSKDTEHLMHSKLFESLFSKYQIGFETTIKGNSFIINHVHLLYSKCHKTIRTLGGSYIDSFSQLDKKSNKYITLVNDNKCFQHTVAVALYYEETGKHTEGLTKF